MADSFEGSTIEVSLGDYMMSGPSPMMGGTSTMMAGAFTAPAGAVRLHVVNRGGIVHNVGVRRGPISKNLQPGESTMIVLGELVPGTYTLYCDVEGHVEHGMTAQLTVVTPAP